MDKDLTPELLTPEPTVLDEEFSISPEHLEFAKCYLSCLDLNETAKLMRMDLAEVTRIMKNKSVRTLVDNAFLDQGYMNRSKISSAMSSVIEAKLAEMEETELVSGKDISELLATAHKMRLDEMKLQLKLMELEIMNNKANNNNGPKTAVQINNNIGEHSNYGNLLQRIVAGEK